MDTSIIGQIAAFRRMTVGELRVEWERLFGESTRSRNRTYLSKRLAWRVQQLAHGGLSERAKARIEELAPDGFVRARPPAQTAAVADPEPPQPPPRPR